MIVAKRLKIRSIIWYSVREPQGVQPQGLGSSLPHLLHRAVHANRCFVLGLPGPLILSCPSSIGQGNIGYIESAALAVEAVYSNTTMKS